MKFADYPLPATPTPAAELTPVSEAAFHKALARATQYTPSPAGDTFLTALPEGLLAFIRVNDAHFSLETDAMLTHAQILSHLAYCPGWQAGHPISGR